MLVAENNCGQFQNIRTIARSTLPADTTRTYLSDFRAFRLDCGQATISVVLELPLTSTTNYTLRKYSTRLNRYVDIPGIQVTSQNSSSAKLTTLRYTVIDNSDLDDSLVANVIEDPVAIVDPTANPGIVRTGAVAIVPAIFFLLLLLVLLLLVASRKRFRIN